MSNEEIRLAIAQVLEPQQEWEIFEDIYLNAPQPYRKDVGFRYPAHSGWIIAKNYPEDLNAMHEAAMSMTTAERKEMRFWLYELTDQMSAHDATAKQRAVAFLRVKGLWK